MAKRRKPAPETKKGNSEQYFTVSLEKKKKLLGLLLIVFAVLILLSILTYARIDKAIITGRLEQVIDSLQDPNISYETSNWLGITGVYTADFFINSTFGIFSVVIPLILGMWGYSLFQKINFRILIHTTNFLLLGAFLGSSFFGVLYGQYDWFASTKELYGSIGEFLGLKLGMLLGGIGSIILIITLFLVSLVIVFDIKIEKIFELIKRFFRFAFSSIKENLEKEDEPKEVDSKAEENIKKIKELRPEKNKKKKIVPVTNDETAAEIISDSEPETKIRIIRPDAPPIEQDVKVIDDVPEENKEEEEAKKLAAEKAKEIAEKAAAEKENEAKLPDQWEEKIDYKKPPLDLLNNLPAEDFKVAEEELKRNAELLKEKLKLFDISIEDISVTPGPVVTLYEIVPSPGVKISKIVGLENDIALALAARGIRIIAPIPGKSAIGVEIPNAEAALVAARSVVGKIHESKAELPLALGKTISGDIYITDLSKMPHMLIAGSTGSGKSVGVNMIISSILYSKHPSEVKLAIIDPKKIELSFYQKLRCHYLAVSPDLEEEIITTPQNAVLLLKSVEYEMEKRYDKLAKAGCRNIVDYNIKISDPHKKPKDTDSMKHHFLPYIIVVIDELADLMITSGKEVEEPIARLAQLARAVGIHLVVATQRPSVNVITGVIKANFSARVAYQVATKIDSRTILDMNGAEQLLGKGDMLFLPTGQPKPIRIQNAFITTDEVERLTEYIAKQPSYSKPYFLPSLYDKKKDTFGGSSLSDLDPMFEEAARVIVNFQQGSVSLLQRKLKLGYSRAARIVDQLEEAGIVGGNDGSKARAVLVENEEQLETIIRNL